MAIEVLFLSIIQKLDAVTEAPHHHIVSFKIKNRIFASLNVRESRACVKLTQIDQSSFCSYNLEHVYPVPNKWGKHGWTNINLKLVHPEMLGDALNTAYETVKLNKKLSG
jgi:hypothetical protein